MTKETLRFLHAADIHLDSPLKGLEAIDDAPVAEIRGATRRAFQDCITMAIEERLDFVLIAGDLYDGDWKDYNTGIFFATQMRRLEQADIPVFLVSGNHDAANLITRTMPLPGNVTLFSAEKPSSIRLQELGVVIHGRSYGTRAVEENLAAQFPTREPGLLNIGLLHTSLTGREGHDSYAPCTIDDLRSKGYDYWALGHIHKREVVSDSPWIVFPGNIQGRHIRETGPKGVTLVTVENGEIRSVEGRELDVLRWSHCRVDLSDCGSAHEVYEKVQQGYRRELEMAGSRLLALRLLLTGSSPIHSQLLERTTEWTEEFRSIAEGLGNIWLEKVKFLTTRIKPLRQDLEGDSALSGLLEAIEKVSLDGDALLELVPELTGLKNKLPAEIHADNEPFPATSAEALQELRTEVQELLLARLLQHSERS